MGVGRSASTRTSVFAAARLWRWWTDGWRTPRRARLTYLVMTVGFAGLAVAAVVLGRGAVAGVAGVVAVLTAALAVIAPRLTRLTGPPRDLR